jgi:hypothetical protein
VAAFRAAHAGEALFEVAAFQEAAGEIQAPISATPPRQGSLRGRRRSATPRREAFRARLAA